MQEVIKSIDIIIFYKRKKNRKNTNAYSLGPSNCTTKNMVNARSRLLDIVKYLITNIMLIEVIKFTLLHNYNDF